MTYQSFNALHFACIEGHSNVIEQLVGYGANVKAEDDKKVTPLHFILVTKNKMKPLSECTPYLNNVSVYCIMPGCKFRKFRTICKIISTKILNCRGRALP